MEIWILISETAFVLLMTTKGNTANQSCAYTDQDDTVSCAFDVNLCQWENVLDDNFDWYNDFQNGSDEDTDDNKVGIAIGITVSLLATGAIMVVVVVVIRRRKGEKICGFGSLRLLHCLKEKRNPDQSSLSSVTPGDAGATYSQGQGGVSHTAASGDMYAKVNKKSTAPGDRGTHRQTTHGAMSGTLNYKLAGSTLDEPRGRNEADGCYYRPDDTASTSSLKRKNDNGYDLARVNKSKVTGTRDEYNKLSHKPNRTKPAQHHTNHSYDHLDQDIKTTSEQQTSTSEYSLARVDNESSVRPIAVALDGHVSSGHVIVPSKSDGKTNYVNVNPGLKTPLQTTEAEYNRLDFDRQHEAKATGFEETGGHAVYNHLHDEDGEYHQLHLDHNRTHNAEVRCQENTDGHDMYYNLQADA